MSVFDKPKSHAMDAIEAAVAMQESLQKFNANSEKYNLENPLNIGTGINTGIGMIGTLGSDCPDGTYSHRRCSQYSF